MKNRDKLLELIHISEGAFYLVEVGGAVSCVLWRHRDRVYEHRVNAELFKIRYLVYDSLQVSAVTILKTVMPESPRLIVIGRVRRIVVGHITVEKSIRHKGIPNGALSPVGGRKAGKYVPSVRCGGSRRLYRCRCYIPRGLLRIVIPRSTALHIKAIIEGIGGHGDRAPPKTVITRRVLVRRVDAHAYGRHRSR